MKNIKAIKAALLTYFNDPENKEMIFRMFRKKKEIIVGKSYKQRRFPENCTRKK